MRKMVISMAVIALMAPLSMGGVQTANAYSAEDAAVCGALPNMKWTWQVTVTPPQVIEGPVQYGDVIYSGNSGNGSAPATQQITTIPGSTICTALNPAGKVNADHSTEIGGGEPVTETVSLGTVQVCFNSPNATDIIEGCR